jgi:hypothetical protein
MTPRGRVISLVDFSATDRIVELGAPAQERIGFGFTAIGAKTGSTIPF